MRIEDEYRVRAQRLRELGFMKQYVDWRRPSPVIDTAYRAYLDSQLWRDAHQRFRASANDQCCCYVCGADSQEMHHVTYARLGDEPPEDLIALCRLHHAGVSHDVHDHRRPLISAHREARRLWLETWLRPLGAEMAERIDRARTKGRIEDRGDTLRLYARHRDWSVFLDLGVATSRSDPYVLSLRFPDGPSTTRFELTESDDDPSGEWDADVFHDRERERKIVLARHPKDWSMWPPWMQPDLSVRRFPRRWR